MGMSKNSEEFKYLMNKFPHMSQAKIKERTFAGSQIKHLMILFLKRILSEKQHGIFLKACVKIFWEVEKVKIMKIL